VREVKIPGGIYNLAYRVAFAMLAQHDFEAGGYCYLPLYVFCGRQLLGHLFTNSIKAAGPHQRLDVLKPWFLEAVPLRMVM
jgi:hypothetical protein